MESASNGEISQYWHKDGKCPKGTVPIRRSASSITRKHPSLLRRHFNSSLVERPTNTREYALVRSHDDRYFGGSATLTIWKPKVEDNEFSLTQLWITSGNGANLNTIEVGWMVYPDIYGDDEPRFFIYWTRDGYNTTGCYDFDCPGFVQTDFIVKLGQPISRISTVGGRMIGINIMIYKVPPNVYGHELDKFLTDTASSYIGWLSDQKLASYSLHEPKHEDIYTAFEEEILVLEQVVLIFLAIGVRLCCTHWKKKRLKGE
ncbi:uncharacterized protein LOC124943702 [Impatiens glandulifera]|uniref:uncharacterized protein LOC124943702 n=1 Tax=Impatiens glandulifera TaxID=253017 RepID=UPI001FB1602A|nr:uncharacterized protein LOC124943702 [Impatiens glandulifera]